MKSCSTGGVLQTAPSLASPPVACSPASPAVACIQCHSWPRMGSGHSGHLGSPWTRSWWRRNHSHRGGDSSLGVRTDGGHVGWWWCWTHSQPSSPGRVGGKQMPTYPPVDSLAPETPEQKERWDGFPGGAERAVCRVQPGPECPSREGSGFCGCCSSLCIVRARPAQEWGFQWPRPPQPAPGS